MKKIVVADDDRSIVKILSALLKHENYQVKTAPEGASALKYIKEFKPDLVILDIMMPIIDGYHICKILSEDTQYEPVPKIIVLTARKEEWDRRISSFAGADAFIQKPFNTTDVLSKIKELIG
ncbi:MAG: hypothetical protein A2252_10660 [Elusimicrobia bacterium RIFOXYA2_FULL_39_19]|nr:MAG: hypothetical protein A2252_10660 [Elusimicrobia bacterium RIFOXYA2_FULL_39_19]